MNNDASNAPQGDDHQGDEDDLCTGCGARLLPSQLDLLCPACLAEEGDDNGHGDAGDRPFFPHVSNPSTGKPFTYAELNDLHCLLTEEIRAFAEAIVRRETDCLSPGFEVMKLAMKEAAGHCLFNALYVADAVQDRLSQEVQ